MTALWVTLAVLLDGAVALVGGALPDRWLLRHRGAMLAFAAGALLSAALLDLLPEAIESSGLRVLPWLLGGVVVLAILEAVFAAHAPHDDRRMRVGPIALVASDALHNFGDGIAIAAAFASSAHLGLVTSLAVIVHELPEELADYAVLRSAEYGKARALLVLAAVQLTAGLGAAATLFGLHVRGTATGYVVAIAAGTFVYIACADLLPELLHGGARAGRRATAMIALVIGALVIAFAS